jgi:antitoxin PrlF
MPRLHFHGNTPSTAIAQSKLTAQGQISVPAEVRRKLGLGPGSVIEWNEHEDGMVVRRAGRYTTDDLHRAAFADAVPKARTLEELRDGIRRQMKSRYARR